MIKPSLRIVLFLSVLLFICYLPVHSQVYKVVDSTTQQPVSYATISFGNGQGIFADEAGDFNFSKKRYPDITSLYISALGYKELSLHTSNLPAIINLVQEVAELKEVLITAENLGKYKTKKKNAIVHNDYFKSWLPTVESEVAVYFPKIPLQRTKIASVYLPILLEDIRGPSGKKQQFSTQFKMQFYKNKKGAPGKRLPYKDVFFRITDKSKSNFELDISDSGVFIPEEGIFISIQVLGYTDKNGKLQQGKKYHEVETNRGIVKIPTTFRPLLPFTNKIKNNITFARRIFFRNRTWQRFDKNYTEGNNLIRINHVNYGMGLKLHVYDR
ncbi:carboxypeptidase-like regulatory domain-containing protein [Aquimarina sp. ERC-38]|uniref:hypothetical protein n=1 Tax=Aquimarina sp. ERC-38 TaxID=2949996 RepID=UPI00224617B2|nr:hypothetical protein [Aquimarina sp. ERC-38]UZO80109.1 carboxypeptidase-like regulatory domain-containing protein [Aquimarina sp. ERC-38]